MAMAAGTAAGALTPMLAHSLVDSTALSLVILVLLGRGMDTGGRVREFPNALGLCAVMTILISSMPQHSPSRTERTGLGVGR